MPLKSGTADVAADAMPLRANQLLANKTQERERNFGMDSFQKECGIDRIERQ
jgi:hypothetical protein